MPSLHLGCGCIHYLECINVDIKPLKAVDVIADIKHLPFKDKCADTVIAHHVFEHIPRQEVTDTLNEWHRVLKLGGKLDVEMPDFDQNCKDYIEALNSDDFHRQGFNKAFIYGGDTPALEDGHRWGYTPSLMRSHLREVGFRQIDKVKPTKIHRDQAACFRIIATK